MPKGNSLRGVIDPITILGVLLLITTLGIGTYVVNNKNISLNIAERASTSCSLCLQNASQSDCASLCSGNNNSGILPLGVTTIKNNNNECIPNCNNKNCGSDGCGGKCGTCVAPATCSGAGKCVKPATPAPTTSAASSCTSLCLQNATPDECGCNGNIPAGVILPPSGQTGSNASTYNDGIQGNDYVGTVSNNQNTQTPQQLTTNTGSCNANGVLYPIGSNVIGGTGQNSSGYATCTSTGWQDCPNCSLLTLTTVPTYLQEEHAQAVQNQQLQQANYEDQIRSCTFDGGQWNNTTKTCFNPNINQVVNQIVEIQDSRPNGETRCSGSILETWNSINKRWNQSFCQNGCSNNQCNNPPISNFIVPANSSNLFQGLLTGGANPATQNNTNYSSQYECEKNTNPYSPEWRNCSIYATEDEMRNVLLESLASLSNSFNNALSSSNMDGFGTYGLGGGNAYVAPVPLSVITSNNPESFSDYAQGNITAFGAGGVTAVATVTVVAPTTVLQTILSIRGAVQVLTALDVADLATTNYLCSQGNQNACAAFVATATIPAPSGITSLLIDSVGDFATAWSGTGSVIRGLTNNVPSINSNNFYFDNGATILTNNNTLNPNPYTFESTVLGNNPFSLANGFQGLSGGIGGWPTTFLPTSAVTPNTSQTNSMLFAPSQQSFIAQMLPNIPETGGGTNINRIVNNLTTNSPGFQIGQVDNIQPWSVLDSNQQSLNNVGISQSDSYFGTTATGIGPGQGAMGFNQSYLDNLVLNPPVDSPFMDNFVSFLNNNNINSSFPDVTLNNWYNAISNDIANRTFGNPIPTTLDSPLILAGSQNTITNVIVDSTPTQQINNVETPLLQSLSNWWDNNVGILNFNGLQNSFNDTININNILPPSIAGQSTAVVNGFLPTLRNWWNNNIGVLNFNGLQNSLTGTPNISPNTPNLTDNNYLSAESLLNNANNIGSINPILTTTQTIVNTVIPPVSNVRTFGSYRNTFDTSIPRQTIYLPPLQIAISVVTLTIAVEDILENRFGLDLINVSTIIANVSDLFYSIQNAFASNQMLYSQLDNQQVEMQNDNNTPPETIQEPELTEAQNESENNNIFTPHIYMNTDGTILFTENYVELPSSAFSSKLVTPTKIVIHWDGNANYDDPTKWTTSATYNGLVSRNTSSHFAVGVDGVVQFVPMTDNMVASTWAYTGDPNVINIEFGGAHFDQVPPTENERLEGINLIANLIVQYDLQIEDIIGHRDNVSQIQSL